MATTIRNIPDELLVEILGKLPKKDLKKARLACTLWSTAGTKWMFERVYFARRKAWMKTFADIAANPPSARNVKELIYDRRLFLPELGTSESYRAAFRARMLEDFDIYEDHAKNAIGIGQGQDADKVYQRSIWNMWKVGAGDNITIVDSLARYARLLDQQEGIFKKCREFKALCEELKSFRNISKVGALTEFAYHSNYGLPVDDKYDQYIECHEWHSSRSKREFGLIVPLSTESPRPQSG